MIFDAPAALLKPRLPKYKNDFLLPRETFGGEMKKQVLPFALASQARFALGQDDNLILTRLVARLSRALPTLENTFRAVTRYWVLGTGY
ncbi:MAG TPA: hypothetical protein VGR48_03505 [Terriglobales bacterium]|nr:hypothetical protein [Terriglobales bacterium]